MPRDLIVLLYSKKNAVELKALSIGEISLPNTDLVKKVLEYTRRELREETFNYSIRVYFYGATSPLCNRILSPTLAMRIGINYLKG